MSTCLHQNLCWERIKSCLRKLAAGANHRNQDSTQATDQQPGSANFMITGGVQQGQQRCWLQLFWKGKAEVHSLTGFWWSCAPLSHCHWIPHDHTLSSPRQVWAGCVEALDTTSLKEGVVLCVLNLLCMWLHSWIPSGAWSKKLEQQSPYTAASCKCCRYKDWQDSWGPNFKTNCSQGQPLQGFNRVPIHPTPLAGVGGRVAGVRDWIPVLLCSFLGQHAPVSDWGLCLTVSIQLLPPNPSKSLWLPTLGATERERKWAVWGMHCLGTRIFSIAQPVHTTNSPWLKNHTAP